MQQVRDLLKSLAGKGGIKEKGVALVKLHKEVQNNPHASLKSKVCKEAGEEAKKGTSFFSTVLILSAAN